VLGVFALVAARWPDATLPLLPMAVVALVAGVVGARRLARVYVDLF
jgi:hypothetical protein